MLVAIEGSKEGEGIILGHHRKCFPKPHIYVNKTPLKIERFSHSIYEISWCSSSYFQRLLGERWNSEKGQTSTPLAAGKGVIKTYINVKVIHQWVDNYWTLRRLKLNCSSKFSLLMMTLKPMIHQTPPLWSNGEHIKWKSCSIVHMGLKCRYYDYTKHIIMFFKATMHTNLDASRYSALNPWNLNIVK